MYMTCSTLRKGIPSVSATLLWTLQEVARDQWFTAARASKWASGSGVARALRRHGARAVHSGRAARNEAPRVSGAALSAATRLALPERQGLPRAQGRTSSPTRTPLIARGTCR